MGLFSLFRKLFNENKVEEKIIEKLAFSDIENWIENKIKENEIKENEILFIVREKIKDFIEELKEKIVILQSFDVEAKKEKDETKGIVNNSRKAYIESLENFLENLNNLKMNKLEESITKINKIFLDFSKSSYKNYERATILIGKEMANIKENIKVFSKDLLKIYEENKDIIDFFKTILQIKPKYQSINSIENTLKRIIEKISFLNKKIIEAEKEDTVLKEKIEEIKKGQNYLEHLTTKKKIESLRGETKNDILELKQFLDFKALANFFHINQEQMKIVKNHKEDFYSNFKKDNGEAIIELLNEAKLNSNIILEKVNQIKAKIEKTENHEQEIKQDETQVLYPKIKEIVLEIDNLKIEKVKEEKRHEKIKTSKEELISILKQEFNKINVELI